MKFLFAIFASLFAMSAAANNNFEASTGEFDIKVTGNGNVPKYFFSSEALSNSTYKIMFQKILETDDEGDKYRSISLPSLGWAIAQDEENEAVFWINCTGAKKGDTPWETLAFKNTLFNSTVKFDVILNGYEWSNEDATKLNLAWKFSTDEDEDETEEGPGLEPTEEATDSVCFGNGLFCFDIVDTADILDPATGNVTGTTDVSLTYDGGVGVTVTYDRWEEGDLFHDPEFGITGEESADDDCSGVIGGLMCLLGALFFCF